jgi:cell division protein FtsB
VSARAQSASRAGAGSYRLRPAPRSSRGGNARAGRIQWDRVGRVALVLVLAAILASYIRPALNFFDAWKDSKAEHASLTALTKENAQLKQRVTTVQGPDAAERAARKLGMAEPGEASFVIRGLSR